MPVYVGVLIYLVWLSWKLRIAKHISLNCKQVDILWRILIIGRGKIPMLSYSVSALSRNDVGRSIHWELE
jgi:hypothetical protein